jgi:hypothetical protein
MGNIYPAYASYNAVLSGKPEQHKQWLTYWCVFSTRSHPPFPRPISHPSPHRRRPPPSPPIRRIVNTFFTVFEMLGDSLVSWLPLYWEAKIVFVVWLTLWGGAAQVYNRGLRLLLERYEQAIDTHVSRFQSRAAEKVNEAAQQGLQHVRSRGQQLAMAGLTFLGNLNNAADGGAGAVQGLIGGGSATGASATATPLSGGATAPFSGSSVGGVASAGGTKAQ